MSTSADSSSSSSDSNLERLQSDLDTIRSAIGRGLPFGRADIRFMWIGVVAVLITGAGYHFGAREGLARFLIALPVYALGAAYFTFIAIQKRTANPTRATEYRLGLIAVGVILLTYVPLSRWTEGIAIPQKSFQALFMVMLGAATLGGAFLPYVVARSYRRTSLLFAGTMLGVFGLILPLVTRDTFGLVIGLWAGLTFAGLALIMQFYHKREPANESNSE